MSTVEINIDGLVGQTHNYGGLSFGNVASEKYALTTAHPKEAALQGLKKIKFLHDLGIPQFVLPPHPRPYLPALHALGFKAIQDVPAQLLPQLYSASFMWAANAATISASSDTQDGKVHITPANLVSKFHRSLEHPVTASYLKQLFRGDCFVHHEPLPSHVHYADEGAANHMRLAGGFNLFVYGGNTAKYPARQSFAASEAIARAHKLDTQKTFFLQQSPVSIDAGVFHNDVIAMSTGNLFIYHEAAYANTLPALPNIKIITITHNDLAVEEAVQTYLFNSQLVTLPNGNVVLIAPQECAESKKVQNILDKLLAENVLSQVHYLDVRESMKNGGGPACLRLRAVVNEKEMMQMNPSLRFTEKLYGALCQWINDHYRDKLAPEDLLDPSLAHEVTSAMVSLSTLLALNNDKV